MFSHTKLLIWQKAMEIVEEIYRVTNIFPDSERFGLVSQMRRSAISVASNIAEGSYRSTKKDFLSFLATARGSLAELQTQCLCALRIKMIDVRDMGKAKQLLDEEMNMLNAFIKTIKK